MTRTYTWLVVALIVALGLAGWAGWQAVQSANDNNEAVTANRDLGCAMARLISYVPAIQFEGEPKENFLGWLEARRSMLVELRDHQQCSEVTARLLRERVELDNELLDQLRH